MNRRTDDNNSQPGWIDRWMDGWPSQGQSELERGVAVSFANRHIGQKGILDKQNTRCCMDLCLSILPNRSVCLIVEYEYACVCKCSYHMQQAFFAYLCLQSQHYILPLFCLSSENSKARSTTFLFCEIENKETNRHTNIPTEATHKQTNINVGPYCVAIVNFTIILFDYIVVVVVVCLVRIFVVRSCVGGA